MAEPLTRERLQEIVTAILSVSQPAAIILFGSYARDQVHEFSDVDLLVIRDAEFREGESRRKELGRIYRSVTEICGTRKDIILFTKGRSFSLEEHHQSHDFRRLQRGTRSLWASLTRITPGNCLIWQTKTTQR